MPDEKKTPEGTVSEEDLHKALDMLAKELTFVDPADDEEINKTVKVDASGFLEGLVETVKESNENLAKAFNVRGAALSQVLTGLKQGFDEIRKTLDEMSTAPAAAPKGAPSGTDPAVVEKNFEHGREGTPNDPAAPAQPIDGNPTGADQLSKAQITRGLTLLFDDAMARGANSEIVAYGEMASGVESAGMISKRARTAVWDKCYREGAQFPLT